MATLIIVAVMARPIINLEKVFFLLNAIRFAIKEERFKPDIFGIL